MGLKLGANATMNRNSAAFNSPTWSPVNVVTETLTGDFSFDKADASHRGDSGNKAAEPTLQNNDVSCKLLEDTSDTNFLAIRTAALARTALDLLFSTGGALVAGEHTVRADFKVIGWKKGEPLNGINTWDVELARCYSANPVTFAINS